MKLTRDQKIEAAVTAFYNGNDTFDIAYKACLASSDEIRAVFNAELEHQIGLAIDDDELEAQIHIM